MPTIPNFPQRMLNEHKNWHHARHQVDISNPPSGYGQDFLRFHRDYIARALNWYNQQGLDPNLVQPWASVPEPIRQSPCYNRAAEARIMYEPETFASVDELGRFIEASNLHGCIHQEGANIFGEPELNDFDVAPRNTIFYNIHGMIDQWWRNWEAATQAQRQAQPQPQAQLQAQPQAQWQPQAHPQTQGQLQSRAEGCYWYGAFEEANNEVLHYNLMDGYWWLGKPAPNEERARNGNKAAWTIVGDSRGSNWIYAGRPLHVLDIDDDGRLEVVFPHPQEPYWAAGKIKGGRLHWQLFLPQNTIE